VAVREPYVGQALQGVDDKARLAIPSGIRAALDRNGDPESKERSFYLTSHETDPCLVGYDAGFMNARASEIREREAAHLAATGRPDFTIRRTVMGVPEKLTYDASGRFVLPGLSRFHANIDLNGFAFVHGLYDYFEIWDPKTLIDWPGSPEITKKAARFYMAQKGVTL
jgi:MraZ protein